MGVDDSQLATRSARGDMVALEALYRRHVDTIWRYARARSGSREAASDIGQETFLRVVRSVKQFKGKSAFSTWLFTIARSVAIQYARTEGRDRIRAAEAGVLRMVPAADESNDVGDSNSEDHRAVRGAVTNLPGAQRDAIVLCELSGFSMRQAAETLGWTESRVKVTLFRARRRLRDSLKGLLAEEDAAGGQNCSS